MRPLSLGSSPWSQRMMGSISSCSPVEQDFLTDFLFENGFDVTAAAFLGWLCPARSPCHR